MTATVVLADPHPAVRAALTALLMEDASLEVVPTADLPSALRAVARHRAPLLVVARRLLEGSPAGMRLPGPLPAGTQTIVLGLYDAACLRGRRAARRRRGLRAQGPRPTGSCARRSTRCSRVAGS